MIWISESRNELGFYYYLLQIILNITHTWMYVTFEEIYKKICSVSLRLKAHFNEIILNFTKQSFICILHSARLHL